MVKVATLFYQEGYSQRQIAEKTRLSKSKVSRLLKKARENGIVKVDLSRRIRRVAFHASQVTRP